MGRHHYLNTHSCGQLPYASWDVCLHREHYYQPHYSLGSRPSALHVLILQGRDSFHFQYYLPCTFTLCSKDMQPGTKACTFVYIHLMILYMKYIYTCTVCSMEDQYLFCSVHEHCSIVLHRGIFCCKERERLKVVLILQNFYWRKQMVAVIGLSPLPTMQGQ